MRVALFDFDGTLCPGDSIVPYLRFCVREGIAPRSQWLKAAAGYLHQVIQPDAVSSAKAKTLSFIRGKTKEEMDAFAEHFFRDCLQPRFYKEGIRTLNGMHKEGLKTIVLSASASVYMDLLPKFLPVDAVLSTVCELDENGRYTGKVGPNCRGEEKLNRLRVWAGGEKTEIVCAYGDSAHDIPMLAAAQRPVWVNPSPKTAERLQAEAVSWKGGNCRAGD